MRWLLCITDSMDTSLRNSGKEWKTGRPGVLQFMGLQRVGHNLATEQPPPPLVVSGDELLVEEVKDGRVQFCTTGIASCLLSHHHINRHFSFLWTEGGKVLGWLTSTGKPCTQAPQTSNADFSYIIRNRTPRIGEAIWSHPGRFYLRFAKYTSLGYNLMV